MEKEHNMRHRKKECPKITHFPHGQILRAALFFILFYPPQDQICMLGRFMWQFLYLRPSIKTQPYKNTCKHNTKYPFGRMISHWVSFCWFKTFFCKYITFEKDNN